MAVHPGDKLMSIDGYRIGDLNWDWLVLPPYPDDVELESLEDEEFDDDDLNPGQNLLPKINEGG